MQYELKLTAALTKDGKAMCTQETHWVNMDRAGMLSLEASYLGWLESLPRALGGIVEPPPE